MAKNDKLVKYGVTAAVMWTLYNMALNGSWGAAAKKAAEDLSTAWAGEGGWHVTGPTTTTPPATSSPGTQTANQKPSTGSQSQMLRLSLNDMGGVPLAYDTVRAIIQQDPGRVASSAPGFSPNIYQAGDVFLTNDGRQVVNLGGGKVQILDTGERLAASAFQSAIA